MENQNTRLVNLRDPKKNRKISTQSPLLTRFTYRKQSSTNRAVQSFVARALKRDIALCFLPLVIAHLIANVDLRLHLSPSLLESIGGRIYLSPRLSGIRKIRLAIKSSQRPEGGVCPKFIGGNENATEFVVRTNVSVTERHNLDDG